MGIPAELTDVALFEATSRYGDLGVHAVVDLRRRFSHDELTRAFEGAIEAFPVLGRRYVQNPWRDRWELVDGPVGDAVHVVDPGADLEAATRAFTERPIDVTRERPLRVASLARGAGSRVILSLSHIAVDGGGMAAVGHVLGARLYGVPTAAPADPRRGIAAALDGMRLAHLPVLARDAIGTLRAPLRTLGAAKRERPFPAAPSRAPNIRQLRFEGAELERLKARCRPHGASVNDALIAGLARVSAGRSRGGHVAVLYTMDLRRYARSARLTAANTSSILPVFVPRQALGDFGSTASAVAAVTKQHRRGLAGPASILAPLALGIGAPHALARRIARWLTPVLVDLPLSRGMLVTNVGRIDDGLAAFGDDVESVRVIGPNVRGVQVPAVVAFGYRGALHLELFAAPGLAPAALDELELELRAALDFEAE